MGTEATQRKAANTEAQRPQSSRTSSQFRPGPSHGQYKLRANEANRCEYSSCRHPLPECSGSRVGNVEKPEGYEPSQPLRSSGWVFSASGTVLCQPWVERCESANVAQPRGRVRPESDSPNGTVLTDQRCRLHSQTYRSSILILQTIWTIAVANDRGMAWPSSYPFSFEHNNLNDPRCHQWRVGGRVVFDLPRVHHNMVAFEARHAWRGCS